MIIREATSQDIPALTGILNSIIRAGGTTAMESPLGPVEFDRQFLHGDHVICCHVAIDETTGQPAGFQMLERNAASGSGQVDIATFSRPSPRIRGVGTALFAKTSETAAALGIRTITAQIRADNQSGLAYYEKMGFRTFETLPNIPLQDGTPVDRVLKRFDLV